MRRPKPEMSVSQAVKRSGDGFNPSTLVAVCGSFVAKLAWIEPGRHPNRHAPRSDGGEVLDANEVQGNACAQATRQSHARADRDEGELPLAGKLAPVHRAPG